MWLKCEVSPVTSCQCMKGVKNQFRACSYLTKLPIPVMTYIWWISIQLHCKSSEKRSWYKSWSIYLLHPHVIYTTYISKYVKTTERITIIWHQALNWNWHQQIGNELVNLQQFVMWKYSHHHMNLSDTDAAYFSSYEVGGTCATFIWSNILITTSSTKFICCKVGCISITKLHMMVWILPHYKLLQIYQFISNLLMSVSIQCLMSKNCNSLSCFNIFWNVCGV